MQQDPFVILGVDKNATQAEIDEKYRELRHRYEDARFLEGEAGAEAAEKIEELDNAYSEAMRIKSESANIGGGFQDDSDFKGQDFSDVKEAIKNKNYHLAQGLLDAMQERSAEWHYMQAKIYYDKKWILDAKKQLELAIEMDPTNAKYTATLDRLKKESGRGFVFPTAGDNAGGRSYSPNSTPSCCNVCSTLLCADCCCECMGGDLIPCC